MKNLKIFALALIAALFTFGFTSCTNDAAPLAGGTYEFTSVTLNGVDMTESMKDDLPAMTIKFGGANDFTMTIEGQSDSAKGTYSYNAKTKIATLTADGEDQDFNVSDNGKKISIAQEAEGMTTVVTFSRK